MAAINSIPRQNLVGSRFGRLAVQCWAGNSKWLCLCDCGREVKVLTANLKRGNTSSCGCIRNILSSSRNTQHGFHGTRAYKSWSNIKRRCLDPKYVSYKQYGAKGVTMWKDWINDPAAFCKYVGPAPSDIHSIDRIDNSKGYEPGNVRWATPEQQGNNKTNNRIVVWRGETYTLSQLARKIASECGIPVRQMLCAIEHQIYDKK